MFAQAVQAGSVWVNCYDAVASQTPFGGFKQSGLGSSINDVTVLGGEGVNDFVTAVLRP